MILPSALDLYINKACTSNLLLPSHLKYYSIITALEEVSWLIGCSRLNELLTAGLVAYLTMLPKNGGNLY